MLHDITQQVERIRKETNESSTSQIVMLADEKVSQIEFKK